MGKGGERGGGDGGKGRVGLSEARVGGWARNPRLKKSRSVRTRRFPPMPTSRSVLKVLLWDML